MGMRLGNTGVQQSSSAAGAWQQRKSDIKDMLAALKGGDLEGAKKAFASLVAKGAQPPANSPLAQIGKALQSGDLAAAQQAALAMESAHGARHHAMSAPNATVAAALPPVAPPSLSAALLGLGTKVNINA
jgi:hypothetical protein